MEQKDTRTWGLYGAGSFLVIFVCYFFLHISRYPIAFPENTLLFAGPSTVVLGLIMAAGMRLVGVTIRSKNLKEATLPIIVYITAVSLSRTPVITGFYKDSGWSLISIYTSLYGGMLLIGCVESLYRRHNAPFQWKVALLMFLVMCGCLLAQWVNSSLLRRAMEDLVHPVQHTLLFEIYSKYLPMLIALVIGIAVGVSMRVDNIVGAYCCLCIGCVGIAGWLVARILPDLWLITPLPLRMFLDNTQTGPTNCDALVVYITCSVCGMTTVYIYKRKSKVF